jgi:P27 family predicted phage terminase small subunit
MRSARPELKAIEGGLSKAPPMPDTLPVSMTAIWASTTADLIGRGLLTTSMLTLVETYIGALWLARECRKCIEEYGVLVLAKDSQRKPNPALAGLTKANENIARLADDLGLSPLSRNRPMLKKATLEEPDDDSAHLGI